MPPNGKDQVASRVLASGYDTCELLATERRLHDSIRVASIRELLLDFLQLLREPIRTSQQRLSGPRDEPSMCVEHARRIERGDFGGDGGPGQAAGHACKLSGFRAGRRRRPAPDRHGARSGAFGLLTRHGAGGGVLLPPSCMNFQSWPGRLCQIVRYFPKA